MEYIVKGTFIVDRLPFTVRYFYFLLFTFYLKDNFSQQAASYAQFRPGYPKALFDWLCNQVTNRRSALDSGTGNGQVAVELADYFEEVWATDISEKQLSHAVKKENIHYKKEAGEKTGFSDNQFDLLTVAQAIHWYQFDLFYPEAKRILKPGALIAVIGYGLLKIGEKKDPIIQHYYKEIVGPYWDPERKLIDEGYQTIPFPFPETQAPNFSSDYMWTLDQFLGYARTWSAYMHYLKANEKDPLPELEKELLSCWKPGETKKISFPILFRVGRNDK